MSRPAAPLFAIAVTFGALACGGREAGGDCERASDCREGLRCIENGRGGRQCMQSCDEATRLCADGTVCLATPSEGRICWFGGRTPIGRACTDTLACEPGTVCAMGRCHQACVVGQDSVCDDQQSCQSIDGTGEGICLSVSPPPDASATTP